MDLLFHPYWLPVTKRRMLSPTGPRSEHWGGARIAENKHDAQ
jgi:hypothetical protein